ncbi:lytic murein transglycosylase, partial [Leucobacter sp. 7(1)]|uniref:lytic murein transglycosylase n=1 Tax=Leucobacter sp. 7(1) TaxID=1255613 RepID=UPI0034E97AC3
ILGVGALGLACGAAGVALALGLIGGQTSGPPAARSEPAPGQPLVPVTPVERAAPTLEAAPAERRADPAWVAQTAAAAGIPERALTAYAQAAIRAEEATPGCGIGWNTLAAIGLVESAHGSINEAVLGTDGRALPAITGPALDGTVYDAIPDTDGGVLDGDTTWDRAVGPMQFLPKTWQSYGRDASGDGTPDPHQIDDAAWGAATMLCDIGGDLTQPENWIRAVDSYNPNIAYNNDVADAADAYAAAVGAAG